MASNWQRWMPFHIDRWRGSAHVQAMSAEARSGYLYLLASAWQTEDCTLPCDEAELQVLAGLTDEEWGRCSAKILRRFAKVDGGRYQNDVLFEEWKQAEAKYRINQARAVATNRKRQTNAARTSGVAAANALTTTHTCTETEKKQTPLAFTARAVAADRSAFQLLGTLPCTGGCVYELRQDDLERDVGLFPGVDVAQEYRNMKAWLLASPQRQKTLSGIRKFMASWLTRKQNDPQERRNGSTYGVRPEATVGVAPRAAEAPDAADARNIAKEFWRERRNAGSKRYEVDCPADIRRELERECEAEGS